MSNDPIRDVLFPSEDDSAMALTSDLSARRQGLEKSLKEFSRSGRFANAREQEERDARVDVLRQVLESNRDLIDVVRAQTAASAIARDNAVRSYRTILRWVRASMAVGVLGALVAVAVGLWC